MSRTKKSRKPGGAPTAKPKLSKQELEKIEKRVRKKTGKAAGNRQKEATQEKINKNQQGAKRDPRLGSKTPIVLGKSNEKTVQAKKPAEKVTPIAGVRFVDTDSALAKSNLSPEQEINAIEQDEALQAILAKQEDDIALTEQEVNYYNDLMERHQVLSSELGLDIDDDLIESVELSRNESEEDLWDKLDSHDFSDFQNDENKE